MVAALHAPLIVAGSGAAAHSAVHWRIRTSFGSKYDPEYETVPLDGRATWGVTRTAGVRCTSIGTRAATVASHRGLAPSGISRSTMLQSPGATPHSVESSPPSWRRCSFTVICTVVGVPGSTGVTAGCPLASVGMKQLYQTGTPTSPSARLLSHTVTMWRATSLSTVADTCCPSRMPVVGVTVMVVVAPATPPSSPTVTSDVATNATTTTDRLAQPRIPLPPCRRRLAV